MKSPEEKLYIDSIIKESIRECLKLNPKFNKTDTLILTTYNILQNIFVDDIKNIFLEAPTGSGKSVIGYLINFCHIYVNKKLMENAPIEDDKLVGKIQNSYLLTSSKMLQEQLDNDITYFSLEDYLAMLKGVKNYECTKQTKDTNIYHDYSERYCLGMAPEIKRSLECYDTCPYIQSRNSASIANCTILNYSYFLNVLKNPLNPFFGPRELTIADEAHLIPDIVLGMYNLDLNQYALNQIMKLVNQIQINFPSKFENQLFDIQNNLGICYKFFQNPKPTLENVKVYIDDLHETNSKLTEIITLGNVGDKVFIEMFQKEYKKIQDYLKYMDAEDYIQSLATRPQDIFIKSENVGHFAIEKIGNNPAGSYTIFRHTVYDLSEAELCRKYFLTKTDIGVFMSATLGNIEEFALLMGLKKGEYNGFRLASNFDFSKSPIFLTKSGYLNHSNFDTNIDKIIYDTLYICENLHPNEKGIIHTSTFKISNLLRQKVLAKLGGVTNSKRYLFYDNSSEKEICMELMNSDTKTPYIIIGPSLYEGLDLKDDKGRFNIIMKVPYSGMDDYIKKKMERYPFWYLRQTLEKIVQAIGRTNRHVNDYSTVYLLDSVFEKIIYNIPLYLTERIKYKKL